MKKLLTIFATLFLIIFTQGCSGPATDTKDSVAGPGPVYGDIDFSVEYPLSYTDQFTIVESPEGYNLITVHDTDEYLVVPEGEGVPRNIPEGVTVIHKPLKGIYNASTSVMDFFVKCGSLDKVTMTGTEDADWDIPEVKTAMDNGEMTFVGKYSAPDYETITEKGCDLAIENTMIFHSPEAKELLESLGIPVFVEYSSYENNPLGRMEWIKLYGLLCDRYDEACEFFDAQAKLINEIDNIEKTGRTVAFFYISSNGHAVVRKPGDYVTKMIEMAGGEYALNGLVPEDDNALSTMNIQMESFFAEGYDADILIYNGTIDGGVTDLNGLFSKDEILRQFKAVETGEVYCTDSNLFQHATSAGEIIADLSRVIHNPATEEELVFLKKLK